ncbi:MAG TPA: winged helix-turn-helix domain-containing protein [Candidatus Saccharimonadales bacterium]|nr:winged helix-turn-helix domain-containing protein [Candidatus Saccharimonadales bacterium]
MSLHRSEEQGPDNAGRHWRFGECEFDESRWELRVRGRVVELEAKPIEVLQQLLLHAGEVVTKDELLESVWPGLMVVDGSLATAMSKLRKAMGDEEATVILTVSRVGYRLAVPVHSKIIAEPSGWEELGLKVGDAVPGREHWQLVQPLDASGSSEVWLAEHPKTREMRVFKFASDAPRLKALKREVTLARLLRETLGDRPEFVRVLEWNFETHPYFLESEYSGTNLVEWAENQGGLGNIPVQTRLQVLADVARAVAAAHDIGVLHKDLKPANVLVVKRTAGDGWQVKVADFGSGALVEPSRLHALGITNLGFTQTVGQEGATLTGTLVYLAPEVLAGQSPTVSADVYALGVMLYQLLVGDFRKPLSPGWEADVENLLLREDIAEAASGDPAKRLRDAKTLAERLTTLERRKIKREELDLAKQRALIAERKWKEARARRPWIWIAAAAMTIGLAVSFTLYRRAARDRDNANRQTAIATSINQFLADDLLGRSNPFQSGKATETLLDAVKQASPNIDRQFSNEPQVAARLHHTIAKALDTRTNYPDARAEYERAHALFQQIDGPFSQDAMIVQLERVAMEARTYQSDSLPLAKSILAEQEALLPNIAHPRSDLPVWLSYARGMVALIDNDAKTAAGNFQTALNAAEKLPAFDDSELLNLKQRLAFSYIRLGDGAKAEGLFRDLIAAYTNSSGADSAHVLRVRLNLAQAYMIQGKHQDVLTETNGIYPQLVAKLGPDHEITMQLLSTRAQSEGSLELWDEATRDNLTMYQLAVAKQGAGSFFAIASLSDAALAQCRNGKFAEGEPNARKSFEISTKAFGPRAGLTGGTAYTLASCQIGRGKLEEAAKLLKEIDVAVVAQLAGIADWGANVTLAQGEIAYLQADYQAARNLIQTATPAFLRADAEPYQRRKLETLRTSVESRLQPR